MSTIGECPVCKKSLWQTENVRVFRSQKMSNSTMYFRNNANNKVP